MRTVDILARMRRATDDRLPGRVLFVPPARPDAGLPQVYVVEDDASQGERLRRMLEENGYRAEVFPTPEALQGACGRLAPPRAVILDLSASDRGRACAALIAGMKAKCLGSLPVISLAERDDMASRLAALRAGASRYLAKPADERLLRLLDDLGLRAPDDPYRVLLVDAAPDALAAHAGILREAGMAVLGETAPLRVPEALRDFQPDVLVIGGNPPECSGPELAAIVHGQEAYAGLPILFLSGDADLSVRRLALDLGGDDVLATPAPPAMLVAAVAARARRARRAAETTASLRAERDFSDTAINAMPGLFFVVAEDRRLLRTNGNLMRFTGFTAEQIGRMSALDFFAEDEHERVAAAIREGFAAGRASVEASLLTGDGLPIPFYFQATASEVGGRRCLVGTGTDISRQKLLQAELGVREARLRRAQAYANIGNWDWNIQTGELWWSERIGPLFGHPEGTLETTYENFLAAVHPDDRQRVVDAVRACVESGEKYEIEHRCVWPDGTVRWLLERGDVTRSADGAPLHMLGVVQDITDLKQAQHSLLEARDAAETASRAKSEFLASMSHELRTPLNAILGFAQILGMDPQLPDKTKRHVQEIERAGQHLLGLINGLIDLARIEAGRLDLAFEPVRLRSIIGESLEMIAPLARKRGVALLDLDGTGEEATVRADYLRLRQVVINFLSNAVKYNRPQGTVRLFCETAHGGNQVRIAVSDTGPGIAPDKQARLFTAFDRLGAEGGETEGTGIGLVITRRLVEAMGGSIGFASFPGQGSTFWAEFPVHAVQDANSGEAPAAPPPAAAADRPEWRRSTVLYIEDNPMNLRLMQQIFARGTGLELADAPTAEIGIEMARASPPALILMDINLPGMNGFEALRALKAAPETAAIPVVALTASAMKGDRERGLAAGFDEYVTKPVDVHRFLEIVGRLLADKPASAEQA